MSDQTRRLRQLIRAGDKSGQPRTAMEFGAVVTLLLVVTSLLATKLDHFGVRTGVAEAFSLSTTIRYELAEYRALHGQWPDPARGLGDIPTLSQCGKRGSCVAAFDLLDDGAFVMTFNAGDDALAASSGRRLAFRPLRYGDAADNVALWSCGRRPPPGALVVAAPDEADLDAAYLPSLCRDIRR